MTSIVLLSLANHDIQNDARILRQAEYLGKTYEVHIISYGKKDVPIPVSVKSLHIVGTLYAGRWLRRIKSALLLPLGRLFPDWAYDAWYWQRPGHREMYELLLKIRPDFIHANDWWTLQVAVKAAKETGAKVVVDHHEYAPQEYEKGWWKLLYKPLVLRTIRKNHPHCCASVTMGQGIADLYRKEFGLDPVVVMNAPKRWDGLKFRPTEPNNIKLIFHGQASKERPPEAMIRVLKYLDARFTMHFMLTGDPNFIASIQAYANQLTPGRVFFHPAVKPAAITQALSEYDMGVYFVNPYSINVWLGLPNKFFDFFSAGLAQITSNLPEMARIMRQYGFGVIVDSADPREIANFMNRLTTLEIDAMKQAAIDASHHLNADTELQKLVDLYDRLSKG